MRVTDSSILVNMLRAWEDLTPVTGEIGRGSRSACMSRMPLHSSFADTGAANAHCESLPIILFFLHFGKLTFAERKQLDVRIFAFRLNKLWGPDASSAVEGKSQ